VDGEVTLANEIAITKLKIKNRPNYETVDEWINYMR